MAEKATHWPRARPQIPHKAEVAAEVAGTGETGSVLSEDPT